MKEENEKAVLSLAETLGVCRALIVVVDNDDDDKEGILETLKYLEERIEATLNSLR